MLGNLPSEGIYEDIGAVPMREKDEGPSVSWDPVLEEYDDAWDPEHGLEDEDDEDEDEDEAEGWALSPTGVRLCALVPTVLFLLYCSCCAQGPALSSAYI